MAAGDSARRRRQRRRREGAEERAASTAARGDGFFGATGCLSRGERGDGGRRRLPRRRGSSPGKADGVGSGIGVAPGRGRGGGGGAGVLSSRPWLQRRMARAEVARRGGLEGMELGGGRQWRPRGRV
ncbi:hypothetical protein DAI22_11g215501 [Oryza sativa Japonica Group]|nr:hypothetical protein DAI22_11g215501 [Oryza sativa Japonica Group]